MSDSSAAGIAAALRGFLVRRDEAEAAAGRLQKHVLQEYDVDANAARLLDCYRRVAARPAGS